MAIGSDNVTDSTPKLLDKQGGDCSASLFENAYKSLDSLVPDTASPGFFSKDVSRAFPETQQDRNGFLFLASQNMKDGPSAASQAQAFKNFIGAVNGNNTLTQRWQRDPSGQLAA